MALTFPTSPTVGDTYTYNSRTWEWDGSVWEAVNTSDLSNGILVVPSKETPDTTAGSFVWNTQAQTVTIGTGTESVIVGASGTGSSTLAGLTDVDVTGQTNGQVLTTDGAGNFTFTTVSGGGSVALNDITDVTAAGSTAGQMLTSDGAGAYTFTTPYGDADVATYLNGNVNTNIIPDTNGTYDIGAAGKNIAEVYADHIRANNYTSVGQMIFASSSDFIFQGSKINGAYANSLDLGENAFPLKAIYTNNLKVNTSLTVDGNVSSDLVPDVNATYDLGKGNQEWNFVHTQNIETNRVYTPLVYPFAGNLKLQVTSGANIQFEADEILPNTDNSVDFGSSTFQWKNIWARAFDMSNSNTFIIPNNTTAQTADGAMTWNATTKELYIGDGTTANLVGGGGSYTDAEAVAAVTASDLDMGGNRVLFANVYTNLADLPSASTYHGMFAHVHSEAAAYYAHAGSWVKLANDGAGGGGATTLDGLTDVTAAGSTAGQVLTSDGAGAYTFTDNVHYTDADVATYLNGNLNTDIIPDTTVAYDIGSSTNRISYIWTNRLEVAQRLALDGGVEGHLKPLSDGTYTLGENFTRWLAVYAQSGVFTNLDLSSSNTFVIPNNTTAQTADGALTWNATTNKLYAGTGGGSIEIGGGGLPTRGDVSGTTSSIADAANENVDITGHKAYSLLQITTSAASWVRIYATSAGRTADAGRAQNNDPAADADLIAEVITSGAETVNIVPNVYGANLESTPTTTIPINVTNLSGGAAAITVTLNVLQQEA